MSKSPEITITSDDLQYEVEERLNTILLDPIWSRAEERARRKIAHLRERFPEVEHYDDSYLVTLAVEALREIGASDLTFEIARLKKQIGGPNGPLQTETA